MGGKEETRKKKCIFDWEYQKIIEQKKIKINENKPYIEKCSIKNYLTL